MTIGSRFQAIDLHVHTPGSPDYHEKSATPEEIVQAAIDADLDAVAVTDHNGISWIDPVRQASHDTTLVVFPGFEVNAQGGHLLAIFDPNTPLDVVEEALSDCGIGKTQLANIEAIGHDFITCIEAINARGGLALAAHADGPNGFLIANAQGRRRILIYKHPGLGALELTDLGMKQDYTLGRVPGYDRPIACTQGSDAHSPSDIGTRRTLLRVDNKDIHGLRQAFNDPLVRIRFPSEWSPTAYPHITSLTVSHGFLAGQHFEFNPSLNCLVGGAGSGKSTVIEFLRFALDQVSGLESIASDCIGKLQDLAGVGTFIHVDFSLDTGEEFRVTREYNGADNPIVVTRLPSEEIVDNVDISGLLPVHAYSQGEVISISRNPLAQLELIDRHIQIGNYQAEIRDSYSELRAQVPGIIKLVSRVREIPDLQSNMATLQTQIDSLTAELTELRQAQANDAVSTHHLWAAERNYLTELVKSFEGVKDEVESAFADLTISPLKVPLPEDKTPNKPQITSAHEITQSLTEDIEKAKANLLARVSQVQTEVRAIATSWKSSYQTHQAEYEKLQVEEGKSRITEITTTLESLGNQQHLAGQKLRAAEAAQSQLSHQLETRKKNLGIISDRKKRIFTLREKKSKEFMQSIGDRLSLRLEFDGNRGQYLAQFGTFMTGTHARENIISAVCGSIHPLELAKILRGSDQETLAARASIPDQWAQRIVERATAHPEFAYELESVPIEDLLTISLKVGQGQYRPIEKLSTGQKATLVVLLSMVEGRNPVLFDQPEDALYTPFIFSDIVQTIRREKDARQFILATHNANISVAADVDLGIILDGSANETQIRAAGGLDDVDTRDLLILHLEGGEEAFHIRHTKWDMTSGTQ